MSSWPWQSEVWPLTFFIWISLGQWDIEPLEFDGLGNYRELLTDGFVTRDLRGDPVAGELAHSMTVTLYCVLDSVPVNIVLSFGVALILFQGISGQGALRTIYFLPYVTSSVAMTLVFAWMFDAQVGVVNAAMERLGLSTSTWSQVPTPAAKRMLGWAGIDSAASLSDLVSGPSVAMVVVIAFSVWSSIGYSIVVYLAGLTAIPRDLTEAARMDGAGRWQTMRQIIWPLLSPTTIFLVILNTIGAFQSPGNPRSRGRDRLHARGDQRQDACRIERRQPITAATGGASSSARWYLDLADSPRHQHLIRSRGQADGHYHAESAEGG